MSAKYYYLWSPGNVFGAVQTLVQLLQIFAYMCFVGRALTATISTILRMCLTNMAMRSLSSSWDNRAMGHEQLGW